MDIFENPAEAALPAPPRPSTPNSTHLTAFRPPHTQVRCLNEASEGLCKTVFRPWEQRLDARGPFLRSDDDDPELLLHVPFTGAVKLQALTVIGGPEGTSPAKLKVFINRDDVDFAVAAAAPATQEWDLLENLAGTMEYPTQ